MEPSKPPRVFISYSWESEDHKTWVRYLGERLTESGIEARLDQWHVRHGESFTAFMEQEVAAANFVIVVCTPSYARKSNKRQGGVGYEQQIVSGQLMSGTERSKFIPILRAGDYEQGPDCAIPTHFLGISWIEFRDDEAFERNLEELIRVILSVPRFAPPPLGVRPSLETITSTKPNRIRLAEAEKSNAAKALPEVSAKALPEFAATALLQKRPASINDFSLPRTGQYFPSSLDWRSEVLYFILLDRFSDGNEAMRPLLDRHNLVAARSGNWKWDRWARSGEERWQGGTLRGVFSKLSYLKNLGVTTLWLSPVFKQRGHLDTYHGYCVQDFLDVDPHLGTRQDLVDLVQEAHHRQMRVILSVIANYSGPNWLYPPETPGGPLVARYTPGRYPFGNWRGYDGQPIKVIEDDEDGVWPVELQTPDMYIRAGCGDLSPGDLDGPIAEHKRSDLFYLRKFDLTRNLGTFAKIYQYWIALTDCDGFYIDMLTHLNFEEARGLISAIKEFAYRLGKKDFFLMGEIGGGDYNEDRYLDVVGQGLNAALDIGESRISLNSVAKGLDAPSRYFHLFDQGRSDMGSQRNLGSRHVSMLDDSDHVFGANLRFSTEAASERQVVVAVALQLLTLGIPCIYYGTEQCLGGPEASERVFLPEWGRSDRYLREAMFGPDHPRSSGRRGIPVDGLDSKLPGFGAFGTSGRHCFDEAYPAFREIAALIYIRQSHEALQSGRQYLRQTRTTGKPFAMTGPGELIAWSRILGDDEFLCIINSDGIGPHSADVAIDRDLNAKGSQMTVMLNTAQAGGVNDEGAYLVGSHVRVKHGDSGIAYVEIRDLQPSGVLVLSNYS